MQYYSIENGIVIKPVSYAAQSSSFVTNILNQLLHILLVLSIILVLPLAYSYRILCGWQLHYAINNNTSTNKQPFLLSCFTDYSTLDSTLAPYCFSLAIKASDSLKKARLFLVKTSLAFCQNAYCISTQQALGSGATQGLP